jgi:predicted ester cyclase
VQTRLAGLWTSFVFLYSALGFKPEDERYFSDDFELTDMASGDTIRGVDQFRDYVSSWRGAFPDLSSEVVQVVDGGSWMAVEYRTQGTHSGLLPTPEG